MIKKMTALAIFSLAFGLYYCSSDGSGTSDPTKTSEEFANPTGTLSSSNAAKVSNGAIYGAGLVPLNSPTTLFALQSPVPPTQMITLEYADCTTESGNTSTIDWACAFNNVTNCTASGETVTTDDSKKDFVNVAYNEFSIDCNATDPAEDLAISANGEINTSRTNEFVYCAKLTLNDGTSKSFDGCRNSDGYILVRLEDESFVVRDSEINDACTGVTFTIRDKSETKTVSCDIQETDGSCESLSNVSKIANCAIQ